MQPPDTPDGEAERLEELRSLRILDTEPESAFDDIVELAAHICGVPIALVSLIDRDRQWFKARVGLDATETHRNISFCGHAVANRELLVVENTHEDARFADNPLVTGEPEIRFYAGQPLVTASGSALGTLCVIDREPRAMTAEQIRMLQLLARRVVDQLTMRKLVDQTRIQRTFFDISLELLCIASSDGYFRALNPSWSRVLGYPEEELLTTPFIDFVHSDDREATLAEAAKLAAGGHETVGFTNRYRCRDGSYRWLSWTAAADVATGDLMSVARDVTDRFQSDNKLREAHAAAEQANQAKSVFLATMSHELRTPLNSVIGFTNILSKNKTGNLRDQDLLYLDRIGDNGRQLLSLINDILDLSKIESGRMELAAEPIELGALLESVAAQVESQINDSGNELRLVVPGDAQQLTGDPHRMRQIVLNLVANALKFTRDGTVEVRIACDDARRPLRIDVVDAGVGLPRVALDTVFEPFKQADSGTARKHGGTGLGLSISRGLARAQGFDLVADSVEGEGATFSVMLVQDAATPIHVALRGGRRHVGSSRRASTLAAASSHRTVLVVDDDADARAVMSNYIQELGYQVVAAGAADRAIELARSAKPDLITLDLVMPRLDGWDVLRMLRDDPELTHIPVVICSMVAGENRASLAGAVDVIDKPVEPTRLRSVLTRYLDDRAGRALVVDDDPDSRALLAAVLLELGIHCDVASGAEAAERKLREARPDVIVLDLHMPDVDGLSFLAQLRDDPRYRDIPVVMCTADSEITVPPGAATALVRKGDALERQLRDVLRDVLT